MTHPTYPNVPADADYFIAKNFGPSYKLWKRVMSVADIESLDVSGYLRPWEPAATFGEEVRNLILHGIGAKDRSCFDADRNRFIVGSIEQLDRFE